LKKGYALVVAFCFLVSVPKCFSQPDFGGFFQGYAGEWNHVSQQLIALAEATPADKFSWRPAQGVRSTSEVYMHLVRANFLMLDALGYKTPADFKPAMATSVTAKADVIRWLKQSLDAVKQARTSAKPEDLQKKVQIFGDDATEDGIFLRIIIHNNEHMGQLIAYARMTGVVPPWSNN
jgi:uncharacterized damage-inducible protein DinB